jgi:uncharacterized protein (DUF362 family)
MLSRREFLRAFLYGASGTVLAACAPKQAEVPTTAPTALPTAAPTPTLLSPSPVPSTANTIAPTAAASPSATAAATATLTRIPPSPTPSQPYLSVARGANPAAITRAAIDTLGGIQRFVKSGDDVIIKPNICNASIPPELASTTNPEVVAELVKLCLEAGAKRVRVMDQPFSGVAVEAYKNSGIRAAVERVGGQMEIMSAAKYGAVNFPATARDLKSAKIYQDVLKADVLINVPVAKTHNLATLTIGMKGLMGVILDREPLHQNIHQRVADLSTAIRTSLTVVDAVRVVVANGPTTWNAEDVVTANTIIASHDIVAADAYATQTLFKMKPEDIGYIKLGAAMGLGRSDLANLRIKEVSI